MRFLREEGLTGQMVAADFVTRRIAPLQAHSEPMWMYAGPSDAMRLHEQDLGSDVVDTILNVAYLHFK